MARPEFIETFVRRRQDEIQATVREILVRGNPILHQRADEISDVTDPAVTQLVHDLEASMFHYGGMGIAAPQVAVLSRVFILSSWPHRNYENAPEVLPTAIVNPCLVHARGNLRPDWEKCLSIPEFRGRVPRFDDIEVAYTEVSGEVVEQRLRGFPARLFQHELDHLNGILYTDIDDTEVVTEEEYKATI